MLNPVDTMPLVQHVLDELEAAMPDSGWNTDESVDIINLTFAQESGWSHLRQKTKDGIGTAMGLGQLEPETVRSIVNDTAHKKYPTYRQDLLWTIEDICGCDFQLIGRYSNQEENLRWQLMSNVMLNIALARVKYRTIQAPFPKHWLTAKNGQRIPNYIPDDNYILALGHYWKDYYNTSEGHGTPEDFLKSAKYWLRNGGELAGEK